MQGEHWPSVYVLSLNGWMEAIRSHQQGKEESEGEEGGESEEEEYDDEFEEGAEEGPR